MPSLHFENGDESVPMCDGAPSSPGVQVHTRQPISGWNQGGSGFAIWTEGFAVKDELSVELAWPPTVEYCAYRGLRNTKHIGKWLQIRRKSDDGSNIQSLAAQTVQTMSDAGGEGVIDCGMAKCALDSQGCE